MPISGRMLQHRRYECHANRSNQQPPTITSLQRARLHGNRAKPIVWTFQEVRALIVE